MSMNPYARDDAFHFPVRVFYEDTEITSPLGEVETLLGVSGEGLG